MIKPMHIKNTNRNQKGQKSTTKYKKYQILPKSTKDNQTEQKVLKSTKGAQYFKQYPK